MRLSSVCSILGFRVRLHPCYVDYTAQFSTAAHRPITAAPHSRYLVCYRRATGFDLIHRGNLALPAPASFDYAHARRSPPMPYQTYPKSVNIASKTTEGL